jgi:outer membrane autotransporter protein
MNKIYCIVWNKVRGCFVVSHEKIKFQGKSATTRKVMPQAVAAALMTMGVVEQAAATYCSWPGSGSYTISSGSSCVALQVVGTSVSGSLTNSGTIASGAAHTAIKITNSTISGSIINHGTISGPSSLYVGNTLITGSLSNSGTITGSYGAFLQFNGGTLSAVTNSGTIVAVSGTAVQIDGTILHGFTNSGNGILMGRSSALQVFSGASLSGGLTNAGIITATGAGSSVNAIKISGILSGGITNSGVISALGAGDKAIIISGHLYDGIVNGVTGTIAGGSTGILIKSGGGLSGGITNSGLITASGAKAILISGNLTGGIANLTGGTISGNVAGIYLNSSATVDSITNTGLITATGGVTAFPQFYGLGIINTGSIGTLVNAQGGTGSGARPALTYGGNLPANYYIIVNSPTSFGQLAVYNSSFMTYSSSNTMTFGVSSLSTLAGGHTYYDVITGVPYNSISGLASASGTVSGTLNGTVWSLIPDVTANAWDLSVRASANYVQDAQSNTNPAARGAATVLQNLATASGGAGSLAGVIAALNALPNATARSNAISQTLPVMVGGSQAAAQSAMGSLRHIIQSRNESNNRGISTGEGFEGNENVWMKAFGSWSDQNDRGGVSGFKANTSGLALGLDNAVSNNLRLGAVVAYGSSSVSSKSVVAPSTDSVEVMQVMGYGSYVLTADTEVNFQLGLGSDQNKSARNITFMAEQATATYNSLTATVGVGLGSKLKLDEQNTFVPSIRADYTYVRDDSYSESGAGALNLNVVGRGTDELVVSMDGKLVHEIKPGIAVAVNLGMGYDTLNKQAQIVASYAGDPSSTAFTTYGLNPSPWIAHGGLGFTAKIKAGFDLNLRYDAEYRNSFLSQTASAKLRWMF